MLYSISNNAAYLAAKARAAGNVGSKLQQTGNIALAGLSLENGTTLSAEAALQIKEAISLAILQGAKTPGPSAVEVEPKDEYGDDGRLAKLNAFDDDYVVLACEDDSSTAEKPVMYVEVESGGERHAYLIDVDSIDTGNMTKVEALALMKYMGKAEGWTDPTYADMLSALSTIMNKLKENAEADSAVDRINEFYKPTFTYDSGGKYSKSSGYSGLFEQNRELRETERTLRLQSVLRGITVGSDGRKTLSGGVYM